jgi:hypothetical protein
MLLTALIALHKHSRYGDVWRAVATCYAGTSREFQDDLG